MQTRIKPSTLSVALATLSAIGMTLGLSHALTAHAQTPDSEAVSEPATSDTPAAPTSEPTTSEPPGLPDNFASYTYEDLFSVGFPNGWQATEHSASPQVILSNAGQAAGQANGVRTEVTWFDQPPGVVVPQALQEIQTNGYRVIRYEPQTINGTSALSIWLTDLPEELSNAYLTYIGYENTTAAVISYYAESNQEVETLVGNIHRSFQRLESTSSGLNDEAM
jgi:hypothetical protein